MKIHVPSIPAEGKDFHFDATTVAFLPLLQTRLSDLAELSDSSQADIQLARTGQNVSLSGMLDLTLKTHCARCNSAFDLKLQIPLTHHLVPYFGKPSSSLDEDEEGLELSSDDLDFSFYHGEEIDLFEILAEEALLHQPITYLCQEDCKGLCPDCGINLNQETCRCGESRKNSPFATLKNFKIDSR